MGNTPLVNTLKLQKSQLPIIDRTLKSGYNMLVKPSLVKEYLKANQGKGLRPDLETQTATF